MMWRGTRRMTVVVGVLMAALLLPVPVWASDNAEITSASASGDNLALSVSVNGVPAGSHVDPSSVVVTVDGSPVPASVRSLSAPSGTSAARSAMIVIDTSGSMAGAPLAQAKAAAVAFLRMLPADVSVGLVYFADAPHLVERPTRNRRAVELQLGRLTAGGNSTLYDGISLALRQLPTSGQRLLCVLSDGGDTTSHTALGAMTAALSRSGVSTEIVGYRTGTVQMAALRKLAAAVGGRLVPASDAASLVGAFTTAAASFATQVTFDATLPGSLAGGNHEVTVTLHVGSSVVVASSSFDTALTAVPTPTAAEPTAGAVSLNGLARPGALIPLLALVFVALLVMLLVVLAPKSRARDNLAGVDAYRLASLARVQPGPDEVERRAGISQLALGVSDRFVERRGVATKLTDRLDRADIRMKASEWVLLRTCVGAFAVAAGTLILGNLIIGALLGVLLTALASHIYIGVKAERRVKAFEAALPDSLQLVASSIRTGFSLTQALDAAAEYGAEPLAGEFNRALAETRLGASLEDGLDRVADRMDSQDLRWTVMTIRIQREVGGNLAEVLHNTAATMRERASMRRRIRALSAEGRLSAYILISLPLLLGLFLFLTRRAYLSLLWTTSLGLVMSGIAVVGMVVGWLWMRKLVDVEI